MRISGGLMKGRTLKAPRISSVTHGEKDLRPTSSKVREALFDILRSRITGAIFLDLYAGTGSIGIEALSRGASFVVFVEANHSRAKALEKLLAEYGLIEKSKVVRTDAGEFLREAADRGNRYSLIYVDPPYHGGELLKVLPLIGAKSVLDSGGIVIAEHFAKVKLPERIKGLVFRKDYRYGDSILSVFEKEESA